MRKISVAIVGGTGMVGQRMIQLLAHHPYFVIHYIGASPRSAGRPYCEASPWRLSGKCPEDVAPLIVQNCDPDDLPENIELVFSALDSSVAGEIELAYAKKGCFVVSNASNHRMNPNVPLIIPEVNPQALSLLGNNPSGGIITNPNCCAIPLALSLAPLQEHWPIKAVVVSTWQAVSGAGYPGESAWDMVGNVHPHAGNEEDKLAIEPCKILGVDVPISARCVRVPVADGHLLSVQVTLAGDPSPQQVAQALKAYTGHSPHLPSSPSPLIHVLERRDRPSPRFDVNAGNGMAISIGRIERCAVMGCKFFVLGHNTIRGAAGAAIANAELLVQRQMLTAQHSSPHST